MVKLIYLCYYCDKENEQGIICEACAKITDTGHLPGDDWNEFKEYAESQKEKYYRCRLDDYVLYDIWLKNKTIDWDTYPKGDEL